MGEGQQTSLMVVQCGNGLQEWLGLFHAICIGLEQQQLNENRLQGKHHPGKQKPSQGLSAPPARPVGEPEQTRVARRVCFKLGVTVPSCESRKLRT